MAGYTEIDQTDRRYFEEPLSDGIERLAFINFFAHVERDFAKNRRKYLRSSSVSIHSALTFSTPDDCDASL
jgi:hypothetical protein